MYRLDKEKSSSICIGPSLGGFIGDNADQRMAEVEKSHELFGMTLDKYVLAAYNTNGCSTTRNKGNGVMEYRSTGVLILRCDLPVRLRRPPLLNKGEELLDSGLSPLRRGTGPSGRGGSLSPVFHHSNAPLLHYSCILIEAADGYSYD